MKEIDKRISDIRSALDNLEEHINQHGRSLNTDVVPIALVSAYIKIIKAAYSNNYENIENRKQ